MREIREVSPFFKARIDDFFRGAGFASLEGSITEEQAKHIVTNFWQKMQQVSGMPTLVGDIMGVLGYWPVYKRDIKNGMDPAKALEKFEDYNLTQQSKRAEEMNRWQLLAKQYPWLAGITAFRSMQFGLTAASILSGGNMVKIAKAGNYRPGAIIKALTGKEAVKTIFYWGLINAGFTATKKMFPLIYSKDEEEREEVKDEILKSMLGYNNLLAFPIVGISAETLESRFFPSQYSYPQENLNPAREIIRTVNFMTMGEEEKSKFVKINLFETKEERKNYKLKLLQYTLGTNFQPVYDSYGYFFKGMIGKEAQWYGMMGVAKGDRPRPPVKGLEALKKFEKKIGDRIKK